MSATVSANDPRPPYVQIADDLRRAIRSGELPAGARIDSGRDLAKRYGVALMTVHNALNALKDDGLVVSWQGRGVFVADALPPESVSEVAQLRAEVDGLRERVDALERRLSE
jgi:DNA-binding GntR family transcriptional regulator